MDSVSALPSQPRADATLDTALSRGLGWCSVALGLTELAVPGAVARTIGVAPRARSSWLLRAMGARDLLSGLGLLFQPRRPHALWTRVAGDVLDLALLGVAARSRSERSPQLTSLLAAIAGVTSLDVIAARRSQRAYDEANRPVISSVTINKPPAEVYAFYRRLSQLPLFMDYLALVREADARYSHWVAKLPRGRTISWDTKITEDRPGEAIAWQSVQGSLIDTRGRVTFTRVPGRNMTEVRLETQLGFLGTKPSASVAEFFTMAQVQGDLRRLKQVLETGEVLASDASAHAAQPASQPGSKLLDRLLPFISSLPTAEKAKRARP